MSPEKGVGSFTTQKFSFAIPNEDLRLSRTLHSPPSDANQNCFSTMSFLNNNDIDDNVSISISYDKQTQQPIKEKCVWNIKNRPFVFLLILLLVVSVIGALIYFTTDIFNKPQPLKYEPMDFKQLLSGDYEPYVFNGTWVQGGELLIKNVEGDIVLFDVKNLNTTVLANVSRINVKSSFQCDLSADKQFLLLAYHYKKVFRHSFTAFYDIINIQTGEQLTLQDSDGSPRSLQLAKWSPVGHSLAIMDHNNIYYIRDVNNLTDVVQLTFTGGSELYNGIPDWVYEEEIFSSNSATWFSKQGNRVAYASFNDSSVPTIHIPVYGVPGRLEFQYPRFMSVHYPKVGVSNPLVEVFVQVLNGVGKIPDPIRIEPPTELTSVTQDIILNTVIWSDDTNLFVMWMNRVQNTSYLVQYLVEDSAKMIQVVEFSQSGGWLDFTQVPLVGDGQRLAIIYSVQQSDGGYFKHLVVVEANGDRIPMTSGNFEVIELLKWDVQSNYIYYLANTEKNPEEQYMYRVLVKKQSSPECMSCKTECKYYKADMSVENDYYALTCSGPNVPEVKIFKTETGEKVFDWEMNTQLKDLVSTINLPRVSFIDVPLDNGFHARVRLILPPAVDESADVKYPLLVHAYAGPGSNLAINKFSFEWNAFFSSSKNVIVAQIDGRGSGRMGNRNTFANYRKLGTYEIDDQISVASYLQREFSFIDKSKTAIWGWSYGGYTAAMALTRDDKNVFKCGLSVAPVTDWIYYDSIYTERYMGLVKNFANAYKNASLLSHAEKLRDKKYMVLHGTYDDNVHYQQSMMLSYELERKVILFRQQTYPDESHGLTTVRNHVYQTIGSFLLDCFHDRL